MREKLIDEIMSILIELDDDAVKIIYFFILHLK